MSLCCPSIHFTFLAPLMTLLPHEVLCPSWSFTILFSKDRASQHWTLLWCIYTLQIELFASHICAIDNLGNLKCWGTKERLQAMRYF